MSLDLRIPMGFMFTLVGAILSMFGLATRQNTELYARSLGIDANLYWGVVLLVFGIVMLTLGRRGQRRLLEEAQNNPPSDEPETRRGH